MVRFTVIYIQNGKIYCYLYTEWQDLLLSIYRMVRFTVIYIQNGKIYCYLYTEW